MNGLNGVHGGGLTRTGLPLCQAVLGGVRPSTDLTPVREFAAVPVTVGVQQYFTNHQISWKFSIERAPWWGGFWE